MAKFFDEISHTFNEYLLVPGYSDERHFPDNVSLKTPLVKYKKGQESSIYLKTPMVSAIMQSVSDDNMAISLAKEGGLSFIYCSQSIEDQAKMVSKVKNYKAGFVISDSNIKPESTIKTLLELIEKTGHSTVAVTSDGTCHGKLLGLITSRDYRISKVDLNDEVKKYMTPFKDLVCGHISFNLNKCNDIIWENKLNTLPIIDDDNNLIYLVFRKDYNSHKENPNEILDKYKRYMVGAGINTRDYKQRVPELVKAGVDCLCIDSSEGFSKWQKDTIKWCKKNYPDIPCGGGNVVDAEGFEFLAESGADFIKVGIGGGSICITRETKGIGRGQASAVIDVAHARDLYYEKKGIYVPICSDGGIAFDYHITLALAMGADFVMLGRYFSRFEESPTSKIMIQGSYFKEYWGEGSNRARNWQRYDNGGKKDLVFEEGVDSYVPYAGYLKDNVMATVQKIKSTMCNCGALNIKQLQKNAKLTLVSATSIVEGGAHDVIVKDNNIKK